MKYAWLFALGGILLGGAISSVVWWTTTKDLDGPVSNVTTNVERSPVNVATNVNTGSIANVNIEPLTNINAETEPGSEKEVHPESPEFYQEQINALGDMIRIEAPGLYQNIISPISFSGEAVGIWYFEATFPVKVLDANGVEIGRHFAQTQDEWMTENFVPFSGEISFSDPETSVGYLVFEKDNPSGLSEHADEIRIPVRFY